MNFELPELAYALDALEPYISAETLSFHYGKHQQRNLQVRLIQFKNGQQFQHQNQI